MKNLLLPDIEDLEGVIADYVDTLTPEHSSDAQRELIIQRCKPAFEQLMNLLSDAVSTGLSEAEVVVAFMRNLALAIESYPVSDVQRELIIQRCKTLFEQLMTLLESAIATGRLEAAVVIAFMRDLVLGNELECIETSERNSSTVFH